MSLRVQLTMFKKSLTNLKKEIEEHNFFLAMPRTVVKVFNMRWKRD